MMFILVFSLVYLALNYYVYRHVKFGLNLSRRASHLLLAVILLAALSFIPVEILDRRYHAAWIRPLLYASSVWLGLVAIAFSVFVLVDAARIVVRAPGFRYRATLCALVLIAAAGGYSLYNQSGRPAVKELRIPVAKLPAEMDGFTIVQLSDLHVDLSKSGPWLQDLVARTLALSPDLIVITGDLIDADICRLDDFCRTLRELKAPFGVIAVTGNHEFYAGIPLFMEIAARSDIRVLRNERLLIAGAIELAGIDDARAARRFENITPQESLAKAFEKVDFKRPVILLSHQPDVFDLARSQGADLQLSGHTHAGQLPPMDLLVQLLFEYPFGLYKRDGAYLYTTCGSAFWGPPMRLFSRPEIVKVVLTAGGGAGRRRDVRDECKA